MAMPRSVGPTTFAAASRPADPPGKQPTSPNRSTGLWCVTIGWVLVKIARRDAVAVLLGVALVVAAFVVPHLSLGIVTPLIHSTPQASHDLANTAPIFGWWKAHVGWGTIAAVAIGIAAVLWGPGLAQRLSWRVLTLVTWI